VLGIFLLVLAVAGAAVVGAATYVAAPTRLSYPATLLRVKQTTPRSASPAGKRNTGLGSLGPRTGFMGLNNDSDHAEKPLKTTHLRDLFDGANRSQCEPLCTGIRREDVA
jgi:hypothetical protein